MLMGLIGSMMIGAGIITYTCVLSPKTKRKLMCLENEMCSDFKNMMDCQGDYLFNLPFLFNIMYN